MAKFLCCPLPAPPSMLPFQERDFSPISLMAWVYQHSPGKSQLGLGDALFWLSLGSPSQYVMLLMMNMVPKEHLDRWREIICFDSTLGNTRLPFNMRLSLQLYLCLCYDELRPQEEFMISTSIDV